MSKIKKTRNLHTRGRYTVYVIMCDRCHAFGSDMGDRRESIRVALGVGFRRVGDDNLCADCIRKIEGGK